MSWGRSTRRFAPSVRGPGSVTGGRAVFFLGGSRGAKEHSDVVGQWTLKVWSDVTSFPLGVWKSFMIVYANIPCTTSLSYPRT